MRKITIISAVAAIGLAVAGCGRANSDESSATDNGAMANEANAADNMMAVNDTAAPAPATAAEFGAQAGASDLFEIESSKLAQAQGSDAKVKDFAAMLVKDHTKSTADLKAIAAKEKIDLPPPALDADNQGKLDALKAVKGADFDKLYISQQIPAHEAALQLMQNYAATGDNEAVKGFATKMEPVIQHHLDAAKALAK
ncbi:MAG: DUF4142 domain-containing protein [Proteobacteria bacterium]|nr:DUF4142 domain-containing protein [Pseudomonadota bacterium]